MGDDCLMEKLYEHIINVWKSVSDELNDNISVQRYEEDKAGAVGIILMDSRDDEEDISGETEWECLKLEVHVVCESSQIIIFKIMNVIRKFVEAFETCASSVDGLEIIWAHHLGAKAKPVYTNAYGLQVCKCSIDFNYNLEEE